jgi:hypothetical protein
VAVSRWTADDTYTVGLAKRFYEHLMSGMDNGAALRGSRLLLRPYKTIFAKSLDRLRN